MPSGSDYYQSMMEFEGGGSKTFSRRFEHFYQRRKMLVYITIGTIVLSVFGFFILFLSSPNERLDVFHLVNGDEVVFHPSSLWYEELDALASLPHTVGIHSFPSYPTLSTEMVSSHESSSTTLAPNFNLIWSFYLHPGANITLLFNFEQPQHTLVFDSERNYEKWLAGGYAFTLFDDTTERVHISHVVRKSGHYHIVINNPTLAYVNGTVNILLWRTVFDKSKGILECMSLAQPCVLRMDRGKQSFFLIHNSGGSWWEPSAVTLLQSPRYSFYWMSFGFVVIALSFSISGAFSALYLIKTKPRNIRFQLISGNAAADDELNGLDSDSMSSLTPELNYHPPTDIDTSSQVDGKSNQLSSPKEKENTKNHPTNYTSLASLSKERLVD